MSHTTTHLVFALVGDCGKVKQSHVGLLRTASKQSPCATAQNTKQRGKMKTSSVPVQRLLNGFLIYNAQFFISNIPIMFPAGSHCVSEQETQESRVLSVSHEALNWTSAEMLERPQSPRLHTQHISPSDGPQFISARFIGRGSAAKCHPKSHS